MNFIYIVIWLTVSSPRSDITLLHNDDYWGEPRHHQSASVSSFETKVFNSVDSIIHMPCYQVNPDFVIMAKPYKIYCKRADKDSVQEMIVQPFYSYKYDSTFVKNDSGIFIYRDRTETKSFEGYKMFPLSSKLEIDDTTLWVIEKPKAEEVNLNDTLKVISILRIATCDTFVLSHNRNADFDTIYYDELIKKKAPKKVKSKKVKK